MLDIFKDIIRSIRMMRKRIVSSSAILLALIISMGGATIVYTMIYSVWTAPTYARAANLLCIRSSNPNTINHRSAFSAAELANITQFNNSSSGIFSNIAGSSMQEVSVSVLGKSDRIRSIFMTKSMFSLLGISAYKGRVFQSSDYHNNPIPVVVVSHEFWQKFLGSNPNAIGMQIQIDNNLHILIGIMPADFSWRGGDIFIPIVPASGNAILKGSNLFLVTALPDQNATKVQIDHFLKSTTTKLRTIYPDRYKSNDLLNAITLTEWASGAFTGIIILLMCGAGVLLIIAWVNIVNIIIVQASERSIETSLRFALGANRFHLFKQYVLETLIVTIIGSIGSILFTYLILRLVIIYAPPYTFPEGTRLSFSPSAIIFCTAVSFAVILSATTISVFLSSKNAAQEVLRESARISSATSKSKILQWAFVCVQIAFTTTLITSGAQTLSYLQSLENTYLGFSPSNLLTSRIVLPETKYKDLNQQNIFFRDLIDKLKQNPMIDNASIISSLPVYGGMSSQIKVIGGQDGKAQIQFAGEDYSKCINAQVVQGNFLDRDDIAFQKRTAVVNESFVKTFLGNSRSIGDHIHISALDKPGETNHQTFEIKGIIKDIRNDGLEKNIKPEIYIPYSVSTLWHRRIVLKIKSAPEIVEPVLRQAVTSIDPNLPVADVRTLKQTLENISLGKPRFQFIVTTIFGLCAIALAVIGCYSIIAYTASQRTHEIGIRLALGSPKRRIINLIASTFIIVTAIGLLLGIALSLGFYRILQTQIPELKISDWSIFIISASIIFLIGVIASLPPLIKAFKANPISILRNT